MFLLYINLINFILFKYKFLLKLGLSCKLRPQLYRYCKFMAIFLLNINWWFISFFKITMFIHLGFDYYINLLKIFGDHRYSFIIFFFKSKRILELWAVQRFSQSLVACMIYARTNPSESKVIYLMLTPHHFFPKILFFIISYTII